MTRTLTEANSTAARTRGFTLIETMIAIAIVALAVAGPFLAVQGVLQSSYTARDELAATGLGQEGIEYVRSVRDSNFLYNLHHGASLAWLNGLDGNNGPNCYSGACIVDLSTLTAVACGNSTCTGLPIYLRKASPIVYTQTTSGNTQTKFTRAIRLTSVSPTETLVTVTVSWNEHGANSLVITDVLRSWL